MLIDPQYADHGIGDIAFRCGFGDLPHFTRSFRRRFGMTPSDARERER
jgi:AraC-like DNA-binding protein